MIKAVVFDLGGVLFAEGKSVAMDKLAREHGYDREIIGGIFASPKSADLRRGLITDEEFWNWAREELPENYDPRLIQREWYEGYVLDEEIFALLKKLKTKYPVIAFSGNIKSRVEFLEEKYGFRSLLDREVYSYDYGLTKPDRGFVEAMIEASGVRPEQIVYIEDNEEYAKPARELGVHVVLYPRGGIERLEKELRKLGIQW